MSTDGSNAGCLPPCAICHNKVALYRCPRCHTCTCSLACCREHKLKGITSSNNEIICNGKRDRTKFCSLKGFTDSQLASDYHFLEDVLKVSESSKRLYHGIITGDSLEASKGGAGAAKRARVSTNWVDLEAITNKPPTHPLLQAKEEKSIVTVLSNGVNYTEYMQREAHAEPKEGIINQLLLETKGHDSVKPLPLQRKGEKALDPLVRQAEIKGVNLLRMPCGMMRRTSNTTKFNKKKGTISWKIELCFHVPKSVINDEEGDSKSRSLDAHGNFPTQLMVESEMLESCTLSNELGKHLDVHPGNTTTRARLRAFVNTPRDSLLLFMKRIPCSSAAPVYYKLDPNYSLVEIMKGKTIIEFPTIHVVLSSEKECFPIFIEDFS
jgi:hypothetical protein